MPSVKTKYNPLAILAGIGVGLYFVFDSYSAQAQTPTDNNNIPKTPTDFIKLYYPFAKSSESSTGVPALVTLAQAGLESGWGKHAPGFNFFGITAGSSWTGEPVKDHITSQIVAVYSPGDPNGNKVCNHYSYRVYHKFRKYANPGQSFLDHGVFLRNNSRYSAAFLTRTPEDFARAIAAAGYATTNYADYLIPIIENVRQIVNKEGISGRVELFRWIDPGQPEKRIGCNCR